MRRNTLRTALAAFIVIACVALTAPASAQDLVHYRNADTSQGKFFLGVSGGPTCSPVDCGLNNGQSIITYQLSGSDQQWWSTTNGPLLNLNDNVTIDALMCLGVAGGKLNEGIPLVIWQCNGADDQSWKVVPAETLKAPFPECFAFFNNKSGMVAGVSGGKVQNGTKVIQWPLFQGTPGGDAGWHPDQFWCPQ
jgi:hypothetical protein